VEKFVRIGGAIAVGIFIILGAFTMQNNISSQALTGQVIVSAEPNRTYIDAQDSDGDGKLDWEEDLSTGIFEAIETPTSTIDTADTYIPPSTFTGKFSEAFFKDYMDGKMNGEDFSDPTAFIGKAVNAIDINTQSKRHTRLELNIEPDSVEAMQEYGNEVVHIMQMHSVQSENEAVILKNALVANDPNILKKLDPIHDGYSKIIESTQNMNVPESLVASHIDLLNAYENILADIQAMQISFTDPLYSLARVKGYENDAIELFNTLKQIGKILTDQGAVFQNDNPGALFYFLES